MGVVEAVGGLGVVEAAGGLGVVEAAGDATLGDLRLVEVADDANVSCGCCLEPTEPVIEGTTAGDRAAALTAGEAALTLTGPGAEVADGVTWRDWRQRPDGLRTAAELLLAIEVEVEVKGEDLVGALDEEEEEEAEEGAGEARAGGGAGLAVPSGLGLDAEGVEERAEEAEGGSESDWGAVSFASFAFDTSIIRRLKPTLPSELLQLIRTRSR